MKTLCKLVGAALGGALLFLLALGAALTYAGDRASGPPWCGVAIIEEADVGCVESYDPHDYRYNAGRLERLVAQRTGGLFAPYTNRVPGSLHDTDYEHVVARSEAHASGGCFWTPEQRRAFANDPLNGVLAYPHVNRNLKRAKDAGEWMPDENRDLFAWRVVMVKRKYSLSVDRREQAVLDGALGGRCP